MSASTDKAIKLLEGAEARLMSLRGLIGLDGYVDQILRVVDKRHAKGTVTHLEDIHSFGQRIQSAAGKSSKFELSNQQTKLGGNGVIMANALAQMALPLTYLGNLGLPEVHPVFRPMLSVCNVISLGDPCYTDALEFNDGKIMLSRQEAAACVSWETMLQILGANRLFQLFNESRLISLNNWTSLPHMTGIWQHLQSEICPRLSKAERTLYLDLADPEFRLVEDIREALQCLSRFGQWFHTILSLNQKEAGATMEILGPHTEGTGKLQVRKNAEAIRLALGIQSVVVHPTAYATAATANESALVEGPYVERPLISTGAGDHFNAGYALGSILRGTPEPCLQLAVATSGYYVRTAKSPTLNELRKFLKEIA